MSTIRDRSLVRNATLVFAPSGERVAQHQQVALRAPDSSGAVGAAGPASHVGVGAEFLASGAGSRIC